MNSIRKPHRRVLIAILAAMSLALGARTDGDDDIVEPRIRPPKLSPQVNVEGVAKNNRQVRSDLVDEFGDNTTPVDPFAVHDWQAGPAQPQVTVAPPPPATEQETVAPQLQSVPPLPFKYMGSFMDGGEVTIYLAKGDETVVAHVNDTLQSTYKIISITSQAVEMEYLPTGERQVVSIPSSQN